MLISDSCSFYTPARQQEIKLVSSIFGSEIHIINFKHIDHRAIKLQDQVY